MSSSGLRAIHYQSADSYSPSLLRAESGRDTPQSRAASSRPRSHSSRGCSAALGRKRSRRALTARVSGATPCRRAHSFRALSSSGPRLILQRYVLSTMGLKAPWPHGGGRCRFCASFCAKRSHPPLAHRCPNSPGSNTLGTPGHRYATCVLIRSCRRSWPQR